MNVPTMMTRIAGLLGHPVPVSAHVATVDDDGSVHIPADDQEQIPRASGPRTVRNVEFARRKGDGRAGKTLRLRLDLVMPKESGPHPLVVYIPGGGFVRAPKVAGAGMRRHVAAAGYVVASVEYRTSVHGATYADGMADVRAAIAYLRAHATGYGIDGDRVALWGESAGGYLAAMVGATDEGDRDPRDPPVLAVVDKFGGSALDRIAEGFDDETVAQLHAPGNPIARYVHGPSAELVTDDLEALHAADPATHVSPAAPAFLLFHGSHDRLVSPVQTALLHRALRSAGADSTWYVVDGAGHGDLAVKGGEEKFWTTIPMMDLITDFLDRTVRDRAAPVP